jgi:hypothetical protein
VLLIGMLGNYFGGLNNHIQTLLKPVHIRGQADEILEVHLTKNAIGDTSAYERGDAMFGNLLKRSASPFAKLLKRTPGRPRYKSQGRRTRASEVDMVQPPREELYNSNDMPTKSLVACY